MLQLYGWLNCMGGCVHLKKKCSFEIVAAAADESLQSCPTLCDPIDSSPPGSPVPGILQAKTLEWVAISFSNAWKWKVKVKSLSCVWLLATPWTAAYQAPPSAGFVSRILLKPQLLKLANDNFLRREIKTYMSDVDIICVYDKNKHIVLWQWISKIQKIHLETRYKT